MKVKILFMMATIVASLQVLQAKTLIVSDVDDTIKMTDVLGNKGIVVINGLFREKAFAGMSELYNQMSKKEGTLIYYVSGSPRAIRFRVNDFLEENKFPQRKNLVLKDSIGDNTFDYKTAEIRKLINTLNPDKVILIGDDTEYDPQVYNQIKEEYSSLVEAVYIRAVTNREGAETLFFTPMEIAGLEYLRGKLDVEDLKLVSRGFQKQTNDSGVVLRNRYCPKNGRVLLDELKQKMTSEESAALFEKAQQKVIKTCN